MEKENWWQRGVIYQIYPRSFQDSNGDGVGDLEGICERLDYCVELGVDALWLSPMFPSPMADFGYDVADYTDVDPLFGTLADFDRLLAEVKRRKLKLLLDFVPNHTSDRHAWFVESRASRHNARRDWYLWRDAAPDGGPPNNWLSHFGGSAWEWDAGTRQYYYHSFLKDQPDLNWRNPDVVGAMHDVMRFWLARGVDGFRIDVLWLLIKDEEWRDNPTNPEFLAGMPLFRSQLATYTSDRPEIHDVVAGLRAVADEFAARLLIGEIYLPLERLVTYYGVDLGGVHLPFNFQLLRTAWQARSLAALIDRYEAALPPGAWPNWVLGNHDNSRIATRVGAAQSRTAAMLLLTLRGTPTLYYGDELGLGDVSIPPEQVQDPLEKNVPGKGLGRDPCRTPMQWDASDHAGFSRSKPWLPLSADYRAVNVRAEETDGASLLSLYRQLLRLRKARPALSLGDYRPVPATGDLLAYLRTDAHERLLIVLNLGAMPAALELPSGSSQGRVLLSTALDRHDEAIASRVSLRADEGLIVVLHDQ